MPLPRCPRDTAAKDKLLLDTTIALLQLAVRNLDWLGEGLAAARLSNVLDALDCHQRPFSDYSFETRKSAPITRSTTL